MRFHSSLGLAILALVALPRVVHAAPVVWAVDDGEKVQQDDPATVPLATGDGNPVWSPNAPIRLFATKNETVAFQVVVAADDAALSGVTVDLDVLTSDKAKIENAAGATDPTSYVGRNIERFVEHFLDVTRASGGSTKGESLGWAPGSGPTAPVTKWTGKVPDALIPVEVAPSWAPYPMNIAARNNGVVWIDVTVGKSQPPGRYRGTVTVKSGGAEIASLPVALDVLDITLPDRPTKTMLSYDPDAFERRMGSASAAAEKHLFRLYHRHRLTPMHGAVSTAQVQSRLAALDGSLYTASQGYEGPGENVGDDVLSIGTFGKLGDPDASKLGTVEGIADLLEQKGLLAKTDTFVYATDEDCSSPTGSQWKSLIAGSSNANVKKVRVGWTCSSNPSSQVVDIPIVFAPFFDLDAATKARAAGKAVWIYNGVMPQTGAFFTDAPATSLRVNGWLSGMFDIGRWFYWETTFWYDENNGGDGPYDPFAQSETFHNQHGDWANGDGVLVYPGRQVDFASHSVGMDGVIASIRLKNWRRGIQDAGIYQLARAVDATRAEEIANALLPAALSSAKNGKAAAWSESGKAYFDARKALLALVPGGAVVNDPSGGGDAGSSGGGGTSASSNDGGCGCRGAGGTTNPTGLVLVGLGGALAMVVLRRRRSS